MRARERVKKELNKRERHLSLSYIKIDNPRKLLLPHSKSVDVEIVLDVCAREIKKERYRRGEG